MAEVLLVGNPSKRRKRRRKMTAKQRKYFGGGKRRRRRARKTTAVAKVNPVRRRRRRHGAVAVRRVRRKRNPSPRAIFSRIVPTVQAGAIGAGGGLANDLLYGVVKSRLPVAMQTGVGRHATKVLGAILVGVLGNMVLKGKGADLANGAMTVVLHEALKEQLAKAAPALPLGEYDELSYIDAASVLSGDDDDGVGSYLAAAAGGGMGEYMEGVGDATDDVLSDLVNDQVLSDYDDM